MTGEVEVVELPVRLRKHVEDRGGLSRDAETGEIVLPNGAWAMMLEAASALEALRADKERLEKELERHQSDRAYIVGWNDGFGHVHGPLRFPTMLRKMWSGSEVQAWLDSQRVEAARQAAADEGCALSQAEARTELAEASLAGRDAEIAKAVAMAAYDVDHRPASTPTSPAPSLPTRDEIARVLRESIKVDATGLAPAVVAHHIFGFDAAADRILALFAQPQEKKP